MSDKIEIKNEETINYLEEILNGAWLIHNPTRLKIPGMGKIVATSRLQYGCEKDEIFPYFAFKQDGIKGEIMKQKGHYYKTIEQGESK